MVAAGMGVKGYPLYRLPVELFRAVGLPRVEPWTEWNVEHRQCAQQRLSVCVHVCVRHRESLI